MQTQDKVALVTGANKGIGLETARGLSELGIAIVIASRDEAKGRTAAETLKAEGKKNVAAVRFDVTRLEDHQQIARHLEDRYGKLDILVNNAGVMLEDSDFGAPGGFNTTPTVTPDVLRRTFETNFFAVVSLTQALLPLIRKAPAGRIVNLSSILGSLTLHSDPSSDIYDKKAFAYDASKTAINAFTVHLAQGAARDSDQGQLGSSRMGQDGHGRRGGSDGGLRRGQDKRAACDPARRRPDRRILSPRSAAALVMRTKPEPAGRNHCD
ncbi:MAG TPA: SDR family NAD(P)-dependent oxidoreductase [Isosphaeraceae bacterium]|nr:SDR family NAD(P)-dependent oxidoreductase [Isosphaeraceae bacterium]